MTDWGAMNKRVPALKAGLDLEMPSSHGETDRQIVAAVKDGTLDESILDQSVLRVLNLVKKYTEHKPDSRPSYDKEAHHELARKTAAESAVLLKNDGILPLVSGQKIAIIGEFAKNPRIQGGGSSHINCSQITSALDAFAAINEMPGEHVCENGACHMIPPLNYEISYAAGYSTKEDRINETMEAEAVDLAKNADVCVIFAGLPDEFESEGYDRTHLNMPDCQNHLIDAICDVQKNVVVVLHNGSPICMPWLDRVNAVLEMYLAGQASGGAAADLLTGRINPSGKLAESFPLKLEDNPSFLNFPGKRYEVSYSEGVFIGYRYYDKKKMDVLFPFGYGLSYTTFEYSNLKINGVNCDDALVHSAPFGSCPAGNIPADTACRSNAPAAEILDSDKVTVSVDITNTGKTAGKEIVELYVKNYIGIENRPEKELKEFAKIFLQPGETGTVTFTLNYRSFAYYNETAKDWFVESGLYHILIGASSRDIRLAAPLQVNGTKRLPFKAWDPTTFQDVDLFAKRPEIQSEILEKLARFNLENSGKTDYEDELQQLKCYFGWTPLHSIISFDNGLFTYDGIQQIIQKLNEAEKEE